VWQYTWNAAGLLHRARSSDGTIVECAYDPFARRIEKRVYEQKSPLGAPTLQSKTRFVWDGDVLVHELREQGIATGDPVVEERTYWFEDGGFEPLAHREKRVDDVGRESGGWFHYKNDPIGTPERLVAEDGSVAAEYERKAWGQLEERTGAKASTPIRLQGQYWDEETGLAYNRWRYYDGEGRFVSSDPLGLGAASNSFAFAPNATQWTDEYGLVRRPATSYDSRAHGDMPSPRNPGHESHHIIQDEWARAHYKGAGYSYTRAPAILLPKDQHKIISDRQNIRRDCRLASGKGKWESSLRDELNNAAGDLEAAGVPRKQRNKALKKAYKFYEGKL
jgi:RHS repeat-associated protein